jgi:hypothetical protein
MMHYVSWETNDGIDCKTFGTMTKEDAELIAYLLVSYADVNLQSVKVHEKENKH